jgi:hypothetical protein
MATAANVVKFKRSAVAGKIPATADLNLGEIALNTYDGRVYLKKSVASVESIVTLQAFPSGGTTGQTLVTDGSGNYSWSSAGSGTVTSVSVASSNGFSGTVATNSTTPAITIGTSITGLLKGNGTAISAATAGTDYLVYGSLSTGTPNAASGSGAISYNNTTGVFKYTPPDLSSYATTSSLTDYVTKTGVETLTNKTLTNPTINSATVSGTITGGNLTVNNINVTSQGNVSTQSFIVTSIGNLLLSQDGQFLTLPDGQTPIATENYNSVIIGANTGSFYFTSGGKLKLPPDGDIIDSNGNSVLGGGGGGTVSYTNSQSLTTNQKAQARSNIEAAGQDDAFIAAMILG